MVDPLRGVGAPTNTEEWSVVVLAKDEDVVHIGNVEYCMSLLKFKNLF